MAMAPCGAALVFGLLAVSAAAGEESHIPAASVAAGQQAPVGQQADAPPGVCLLQTSPGLPRKSPAGSAAWGGRDRSHSLMDRNEAISDEVAGAKLDKGRMQADWRAEMEDPEGLLWNASFVRKMCPNPRLPDKEQLCASASVKMQGCQYVPFDMTLPEDAKQGSDPDHWFELKLWSDPDHRIKPTGGQLGRLFTTREPRKVDSSWPKLTPASGKQSPLSYTTETENLFPNLASDALKGKLIAEGKKTRGAFKQKVDYYSLHNVLALVEDGEDLAATSYHLWDFYQMLGLVVLRVPSPDFDVPSGQAFKQAIEFLSIAAWNGRNTLIHCWGGSGRTATFAIGLMKNFGVKYPITKARREGKSVYLDVREQEIMLSQMQRVITARMPQDLKSQLEELGNPGDVVENQAEVWNPADHFDRARIRLFQQVGLGGPGQYAEWGHAVGRQETCRKMYKVNTMFKVNTRPYSDDPDPWKCVEEADFWNQPPEYQAQLDHSHIVEPTWHARHPSGSTESWSPEKLTDFTGMGWGWRGGSHNNNEGELGFNQPKREARGEEKMQYKIVMGMNAKFGDKLHNH